MPDNIYMDPRMRIFDLAYIASLLLVPNSAIYGYQHMQSGNTRLAWANLAVGAIAFATNRLAHRMARKYYETLKDERKDEPW